ncbi:MAG: ribbon-helix-helix protein, CopG family, partial [Chloroflexi bacterium]|nr:ribbon-helix-helix protein, CopG family [Chloroflexota bacterium]
FSLPPEMFQEVQRVKDEEGRDMSELVREALRLYMEDRELRREQRRERLRSSHANQSEEDGGYSDE